MKLIDAAVARGSSCSGRSLRQPRDAGACFLIALIYQVLAALGILAEGVLYIKASMVCIN
jgi:hypothetical protein